MILPSREQGILGDNIPGFAKLQETLLGIHADVKEIKTDTTEIKGQTTEILQETKRIGNSIDDIGKLGGIVKNPQTPAEYYHNARLHELGGDFKSAFTDYEKYISFDQSFIDPFESYLTLLRSQQGNDEAKTVWQGLELQHSDNLAVKLLGLRFLPGKKRRTALNDFAKQHSDYMPVYYELAQSLSSAMNPKRSKLDGDYEAKYLQNILDNESKFTKYYLDKNQARQVISKIQIAVGEHKNKQENPPRIYDLLTASEELGFVADDADIPVIPLIVLNRINDSGVDKIEISENKEEWTEIPEDSLEEGQENGMTYYEFPVPYIENSKSITIRYYDKDGKVSNPYTLKYPKEEFKKEIKQIEEKRRYNEMFRPGVLQNLK